MSNYGGQSYEPKQDEFEKMVNDYMRKDNNNSGLGQSYKGGVVSGYSATPAANH